MSEGAERRDAVPLIRAVLSEESEQELMVLLQGDLRTTSAMGDGGH